MITNIAARNKKNLFKNFFITGFING